MHADTATAIEKIEQRDKSRPFYLHLTYQSVHAPFEQPPAWEQIPKGAWYDDTWGSMLNVADRGIANVTAALKTAGIWENLVLVMTSGVHPSLLSFLGLTRPFNSDAGGSDNGGECLGDGPTTSTLPPANVSNRTTLVSLWLATTSF